MVYSLGYFSFVPPKLLEILEIPEFKYFISFRLNHREGDLLVKISVGFIPIPPSPLHMLTNIDAFQFIVRSSNKKMDPLLEK